MTRAQAAKLIPFLEAWAEGKDVEFQSSPGTKWQKADFENWCSYEYRIKPKGLWVNFEEILASDEEPEDKTGWTYIDANADGSGEINGRLGI